MKITKTKKVVEEDIEVQPGTYYFEDEYMVFQKFTLKEMEDDYYDYIQETLHCSHELNGIKVYEHGAWDENDLPYVFKQFILGIAGKKIEKEEYYKERTEILDKLKHV
jgi:hypothetical protein